MVDVNDTHDAEGKHARRLQQVKDADIPESDREAILGFHERRRSEGKASTTLTTDLSTLRNASERAEKPLTEMNWSDVDDFLSLLVAPKSEGGYGLNPDGGGMYNYTRTLRLLYEWMDGREDWPDFPFWDDIETVKQEVEQKDPDALLSPSDVKDLKQAARNPRDRALIAFLADGPRITLATQLRVGDVDPFGDDPYWTPNEDANGGHKGMDGAKRTFLWAKADVRSYLNNHHPQPDNPEAPLWPVLRQYDPENPQDCALSPDRVRDMLRECADRAGIEKPVNPHSFRHAAMTRLSNDEGLNPQQIQHIAGWADERMLEVYDRTTDEERNNSIRAAMGMETPEQEDESTLEPHPCPNCRLELTDEEFCPNCGEPQAVSARLSRNAARSDVQEGIGEDADEPDKTAARADVLDVIDHPDVLSAIEDAMAEQGN